MRAFTLIELLVVVAIIAILAAIAVPNFLEAQVRAKTTRVRSDMRTLATALESYAVDHAAYPYDGSPTDLSVGWAQSLAMLTTPVAYTTSIPADTFQDPAVRNYQYANSHFVDAPANTKHSIEYDTAFFAGVGKDPTATALWTAAFGSSKWKLQSCGPDKFFSHATGDFGYPNRYDPTNGTVSAGDIFRSG